MDTFYISCSYLDFALFVLTCNQKEMVGGDGDNNSISLSYFDTLFFDLDHANRIISSCITDWKHGSANLLCPARQRQPWPVSYLIRYICSFNRAPANDSRALPRMPLFFNFLSPRCMHFSMPQNPLKLCRKTLVYVCMRAPYRSL